MAERIFRGSCLSSADGDQSLPSIRAGPAPGYRLSGACSVAGEAGGMHAQPRAATIRSRVHSPDKCFMHPYATRFGRTREVGEILTPTDTEPQHNQRRIQSAVPASQISPGKIRLMKLQDLSGQAGVRIKHQKAQGLSGSHILRLVRQAPCVFAFANAPRQHALAGENAETCSAWRAFRAYGKRWAWLTDSGLCCRSRSSGCRRRSRRCRDPCRCRHSGCWRRPERRGWPRTGPDRALAR